MRSLENQVPIGGSQIVFLDTCVMLDYLENRNEKVRDIVAQLLLLHENGQIALTTSIFNIAELIDKEFEIHFIGNLVAERLSYDEIASQRGNRTLLREVSERTRGIIEDKVRQFVFDKSITILMPTFQAENEEEEYNELYNLIYEYQLKSQDAIIVATALQNNVTYFLSNDTNLVSTLNNNGLIDAYSLRDRNQRQAFKDNVLNSKVEVLA